MELFTTRSIDDETRGASSSGNSAERFCAKLAVLALFGLVLVACSNPGSSTPSHQSIQLGLASADAGDGGMRPDIFGRIVPSSGPPQAFVIKPEVNITEQEFLDQYAHELWELTDKDEIIAGGAPLEDHGYVHQVYLQVYAGFRVAGGSLVLTSHNGRLFAGGGDFVAHVDRNLGGVELADGTIKKARVHHGEAKQLAFDAVSFALGSKKRVAVEEEPKGEMVLSHGRAAWRFTFLVKNPFSQRQVDIDADNGKVLANKDLLLGLWEPRSVPAIGIDNDGDPFTRDDKLTIVAEVDDTAVPGAPKTRLRNSDMGLGVYDDTTVPLNAVPLITVDFTSTTVGFDDPLTDFPVTTMWAMESSISYLFDTFGLVGLDGAGHGVDAHLNFRAIPTGNFPQYAAGYGVIIVPTVYTLGRYDTIAHEMAHAAQTQLANAVGILPDDTTEKAALGESYGDILGMAVEERITGKLLDWGIGKPVARKLDDPTTSPSGSQSIFYGDAAFVTGDKYARAGVQSKWFYILATGGNPPIPGVKGVGVDTARRIALGTMIYGKPETYVQAAELSLQQAAQLCGSGSQLWISVNNAWISVGVAQNAVYTEPFFSPAEGAVDVQPWPAEVSFSPFDGEQAWEIEIDTVDTFDSVDHRGPLSVTGTDPTAFQSIDLNLRPGTKYFWRVRSSPAQDTALGCWRETHSFSTASKAPELVSPTTGADLNPWGLDFKWNEAGSGSVGTTLTINAASHAEYSQQLPPCTTGTTCSKTENLPVDSDFSWLVQLNGPTDLYSPNVATSQSATLHTSSPKSGYLSQSGGPWPTKIVWKEVPAATGYAASIRTSWGDDIWSVDETSATEAEMDLDPNFPYYELTLEPLGPDKVLGVAGAQERGKKTTDPFELSRDVRITTAIQITEPQIHTVECRRQGTDVAVTWNQVEGAEYYIVSVYEQEIPWPSGNYDLCADHGAPIDEIKVLHQPGAATGSLLVPAYRGSFSRFLAAGYVVNVVGFSAGGRFDNWCGAILPNGERCRHDGCVWQGWVVQPEPPIPTAALSGTVQEGNISTLEWKYALANGGSFYVETFDGLSCDGGFTTQTTVETGFTTGVGSLGVEWGSSGSDVQKSWRVRPTGIYEECDQSPQWAPCQGITVKASCGDQGQSCCAQSAPCKHANLVCDGGICTVCGPEGSPCCGPDQGAPCGIGLECKSGKCSVPGDVLDCGQPVVSGNSIVPEPHVINLKGTKGQIWFGFNTVNIPDRIVVRQGSTEIASTASVTGTDGCVGTASGMLVDLIEGGDPFVTVYVEPNCDPANSGDTVWAYQIGCATESATPTAGPE